MKTPYELPLTVRQSQHHHAHQRRLGEFKTTLAVRTQLRVLEEKGHVRRESDAVPFVYMPSVTRQTARKSALRHLVDTFFDGSAENAVAALLGGEGARLTDEQLERISELIAKAKKGSGS